MSSGVVAWWYLTKESFLFLRRDRIFFPLLLMGAAIAFFANLASTWTFEDWEKILFDIGLAGFRLTGGLVAILWGVRMISDPMQDRSIELRIAAPSARSTWILARYTGLGFCLVLMGGVFVGIWQAMLYWNGFGTMNNLQNWAFGMIVLEWLVLGSLGLLAGTISSFSTGMFMALAAWIVGLVAPIVASTMLPDTDPLNRQMVEILSNVWNFQRFNLTELLENGLFTANLNDLAQRLTWAGSVLLGCLVLSAWIFQQKDLT